MSERKTRADGWWSDDGGLSWNHPAPHAAVAPHPNGVTVEIGRALERALNRSVTFLSDSPWISVRDSLPKTSARVLAVRHTRPRAGKPSRSVVLLARYSGDEWRFMEAHVKKQQSHGRVSHWMPLPETP